MDDNQRGAELRIALSMRGGVSLAVWIGGAVEELDRLTRAKASEYDPCTDIGPPNTYAALLSLGGYQRAALDVITGASAGGLNGVVLAASRAYGFKFSAMLPIWVRLADIELLTRDPVTTFADPETGKKSRRPESLLKGDAYFEARLRTELRRLVREGTEGYAVADPFDLILSATLVNPKYETTDVDPFSPLPEVRRSANFHFRFLGELGDNGGDFQGRGDAVGPLVDSTVALLAKAGRSTSSFPVAFEPARVGAESARVFSDPPGLGEPAQRVLDGGVLDNIPVTKAIEAIAAAPSTGLADRWLVFLHPSPGARAERAATQSAVRASPQAFGTLLVTAGAAFGQESLLDDLDELERHNAEAARQRKRREALLSPVVAPHLPGSGERLCATSESALAGSQLTRAHVDTARAMAVVYGDLRVRRPLAQGPDRAQPSAWLRDGRRQLAVDIERSYLAFYRGADGFGDVSHSPPAPPYPDSRLVQSAGGLLLACDLVAGWVRRAQPVPTGSSGSVVGSIAVLEGNAHRVSELRRVVQTARNWSDQAWLVAAANGPYTDQKWVTSTATLATDAMRWVPIAELTRLAAAHGMALLDPERPAGRSTAADSCTVGSPTACLADLDERMRAIVQARVRIAVNERGALGEWVWRCLVDIVEQTAPAAMAGPYPADRVLAVGAVVPDDETRIGSATALGQLVTILTQAQASSIESDDEVRFVRVTGNNETPLRQNFVGSGDFGVDEKLCGNELANFAALFSAKWRANDWMWGRIDAVKSIVDLTVRPERLRCSGLPTERMVRIVQSVAAGAGMTLKPFDVAALEHELDVIMADPTGVGGDTSRTRRVLTEAMQRRIFAEMYPVVAKVGERAHWPFDEAPTEPGEGARDGGSGVSATSATTTAGDSAWPVDTGDLDAKMKAYRVGSQSLADLESRRRTQIGMRLAIVGYGAFRPLRAGLISRTLRTAMTVFKPVYLFGSFAALNLARAMFLINITAVGFYVGPWRYRGVPGASHQGWEILTWEVLPWSGGEWWAAPVAPSSTGAWVGLVIVSLLSVASLLLSLRTRRKRRIARAKHLTEPAGLLWYVSSGVVGLTAAYGASATGICTGPILVMVGAGVVALLTCLWMRNWARWLAVPLGTCAVYAAVGVAFWGYSHWIADEPWFGYTGWMSVVALYGAQTYIATLCTYTRVLHGEAELMRKAAS